jgi:hypothetical protein
MLWPKRSRKTGVCATSTLRNCAPTSRGCGAIRIRAEFRRPRCTCHLQVLQTQRPAAQRISPRSAHPPSPPPLRQVGRAPLRSPHNRWDNRPDKRTLARREAALPAPSSRARVLQTRVRSPGRRYLRPDRPLYRRPQPSRPHHLDQSLWRAAACRSSPRRPS